MEINFSRFVFCLFQLTFVGFKCPCIHLPGSDKCITYDSRYMAVSIEEAILTFVDQTMDPRIYEQRTGGPIVRFEKIEPKTEQTL